jgi:hypothetical protein
VFSAYRAQASQTMKARAATAAPDVMVRAAFMNCRKHKVNSRLGAKSSKTSTARA